MTPPRRRRGAGATARLRDGEPILFPEELALLGDLRGKRGLHLQCNDGWTWLALAREGARACARAAEVVGVDIFDVAVETAAARRRSERAAGPLRARRRARLDGPTRPPPPASASTAFSPPTARSAGSPTWLPGCAARPPCWRRADGWLVAEFHPVFFVFEPGWVIERSYFGPREGWRWEEGVQGLRRLPGGGSGGRRGGARGGQPERLRRVPADRRRHRGQRRARRRHAV